MLLSAGNPRPMMELRPVTPECFVIAANTRADMQPHLTGLRGTQVNIKTGTPSSSLGNVACRTNAMHMLVHRQSGVGADYLTQELDMETTSITTTSTELLTLDNKMTVLDGVAYSVFPIDIMGSAEDSMHQEQPVGSSKTAFFDVHSEPSVDSRRGLSPFEHTENLTLPTCGSSMLDSVYSSERPTMSMPLCVSNRMDCGLSSENPSLPMCSYVSGMVDSVLSTERPISPSDFLQKNPMQSQPQLEDLEILPDLLDEIDQLFAEMPENITWDCTQLDLNLLCQSEQPDTLDSIVQECGILDEVKEEKVQLKEQSQPHYVGNIPNFIVNTTETLPPRIQDDCVGPVRTRQTRRDRKKPARYRVTQALDNEAATAEVTLKTNSEDLVTSTSCTTYKRKREVDGKELSNEQKYIRSRMQNNLASKRSREKRKGKFENMTVELDELTRRNKGLQDKVAELTLLRDNFKDFVNKFLFQRIVQR